MPGGFRSLTAFACCVSIGVLPSLEVSRSCTELRIILSSSVSLLEPARVESGLCLFPVSSFP